MLKYSLILNICMFCNGPQEITRNKTPKWKLPHQWIQQLPPRRSRQTKGKWHHRGSQGRPRQKEGESNRNVFSLHLQGVEASASRNRNLKEVHEHHELIYQRCVRANQLGGKLVSNNHKHTLSSREVQTAVRLLLPGELAKHAVSEGTKAVTKYSSSSAIWVK